MPDSCGIRAAAEILDARPGAGDKHPSAYLFWCVLCSEHTAPRLPEGGPGECSRCEFPYLIRRERRYAEAGD
jgi:hypothetical protein